MKCDKKDLLLYAVTDRSWLRGQTLYEQVEEALKGGATFIQLREKNLDYEDFLKEAKEVKKLCNKYKVPFVINDNVELAKEIGADGVHVGQDDMESGKVREILGEDKIIGVSAHNVKEALLAQRNGANYLGVGAVFNTTSKNDVTTLSYEVLKEICEAVSIPVIAIGGINEENVSKLAGSGICGVAVISAIFAKEHIEDATKSLKQKVQKMVEA